jgi:hypothetical protein
MTDRTTPADASAPATPRIKTAFRRLFTQPAFVAAVLVLGIAAVGLNGAVNYLQLHFKKQPVPLTRELATLPAELGPWKQVSRDEALEHDIQDVLGTDKYIFRDYVDERIVGPVVIAEFMDKSKDERAVLLNQIRRAHPKAVVNFAVTYYTGMIDTVAHVPDRCYVASGYEPRPGENQFAEWPIKGATAEPIEVRYINFDDQAGGSNVTRSVAYFFHVNGHFESSPIGVRTSLANLLQKHGYYAKVETMTLIREPDVSAAVMTDFLANALPEIEKLLPDWEAVQRGEVAPAVESVAKN